MDILKLNKYTRYFLEGKLSKEKENELLQWVKLNDENRTQFLEEQDKLSRSQTLIDTPGLIQKWKNIEYRINPNSHGFSTRQLFIRVASIAAAFLFGVVLTFIISSQLSEKSNQMAQQNISVPFGAKTNITLPDGSLVWLNSGSSLTFPSEFGKNRPVELNGEAFFEVVKNEIPFIVSTAYGNVEVKGTSFNVNTYYQNSLQTTLVTGSVLVREKETKKEVALQPGQQANLINGKMSISYVETDIYTSWKDGKLIFRKEYLPAMAKRLERWYNVKIELEKNTRLNKIWFTGTLEMESFTEVMELLKVTSPIDYTYNEKTRIIKIKYTD